MHHYLLDMHCHGEGDPFSAIFCSYLKNVIFVNILCFTFIFFCILEFIVNNYINLCKYFRGSNHLPAHKRFSVLLKFVPRKCYGYFLKCGATQKCLLNEKASTACPKDSYEIIIN